MSNFRYPAFLYLVLSIKPSLPAYFFEGITFLGQAQDMYEHNSISMVRLRRNIFRSIVNNDMFSSISLKNKQIFMFWEMLCSYFISCTEMTHLQEFENLDGLEILKRLYLWRKVMSESNYCEYLDYSNYFVIWDESTKNVIDSVMAKNDSQSLFLKDKVINIIEVYND